MLLTFVFPGCPVAKQSFRFAKRGEFVVKYQTSQIVKEEDRIRKDALAQLQLPHNAGFTKIIRGDGRGIIISSYFYVQAPKNLSKKKLSKIATEKVPVLKRPDLGNYVKLLEDALAGVVYEDDACIFAPGGGGKFYSFNPRTVVTIRTVDCLKI